MNPIELASPWARRNALPSSKPGTRLVDDWRLADEPVLLMLEVELGERTNQAWFGLTRLNLCCATVASSVARPCPVSKKIHNPFTDMLGLGSLNETSDIIWYRPDEDEIFDFLDKAITGASPDPLAATLLAADLVETVQLAVEELVAPVQQIWLDLRANIAKTLANHAEKVASYR